MSSGSEGVPARGVPCATCGQPLDASMVFCPRCGTLAPRDATPGPSPAVSGSVSAGGQTQAYPANSQPPELTYTQLPYPYMQTAPDIGTPGPGTWTANEPTAFPSDATVQGGASFAPPVVPRRPQRKRHLALAGISGLLLVAVLASAAFWIYSVFASHTETEAARYLPANTAVFISIDVVSAAVNGHHVSSGNLDQASGQADSLKRGTGLDWQHDILPWVNRDIAYAVFPRPAAATTTYGPYGPYSPMDWAVLIQSRNDTAAQAAMQKAADFQAQQGQTITKSTYGGFTLYSQSLGGFQYGIPNDGTSSSAVLGTQAHDAPTGTTFTAGKGWALIAGDAAAAHTVIDRLNGATGTLADTTGFQSATKNLPSNRFGTVYVDTRALVGLTSPASAGGSSLVLDEVYPTISGYLEWTAAGLRMQITSQATRSLGIGDLGGDTMSLASLVPSDAIVYGGLANLGDTVDTSLHLAAQTGSQASSPSDPLLSLFGIPATATVFQQPVAVTALKSGANGISGPIFLLRAPDPAAVTALLKSAAATQHWTLKAVKVGGQSAVDIYAKTPGTWISPMPQDPYAQHPAPGPYLAGVAAQVGGAFVIATSHEELMAIINAASGSAPSLAQNPTFQQLAREAPADVATSVYYDLSQLSASFGQSSGQVNVFARTTAVLLSEAWNDQRVQLTVDLKLND